MGDFTHVSPCSSVALTFPSVRERKFGPKFLQFLKAPKTHPKSRIHELFRKVRGKLLPASVTRVRSLAAQCKIPPHIAQYPFEVVSQRGVSHPFCLVFIGCRASIAEIPLLRGGLRTSTSHALQGGNTQKRGRGYRHPIGHVETPKTPIEHNRGVSLR